jgi:hypothetical protein
MANAPVLKPGVRKDLGVRIPRPPFDLRRLSKRARTALGRFWEGLLRRTDGTR